MLFGHPTSQWVGLITAAASALQVLLIALVPGVDPVQVALIIGAITGFLGVLVAFLAGQPPTVVQGSDIVVSTPQGEPNVVATVLSPNTITPVANP